MDSKKPIYKSIPFWIVVLILLYSSLGFFTVPYFAKNPLQDFVSKNLNSSITYKSFKFNPFSFSTTIEDIELKSNDGTPWFHSDKIYANLNFWQTIFSDFSFSSIQFEKPHYRLQTENNSAKYPQLSTQKSSDGTDDFALYIGEIGIDKGSVDYIDSSQNKTINLELKQILFNHQKFTTADVDTNFNLSFITNHDEKANIHGTLNFAKLNLIADWQLENWKVKTVSEFISDSENELMGFNEFSGQIDSNGTVSTTNLVNNPPLISIQNLVVSNFKANPNDEQHPKVEIPRIQINNATLESEKNNLTIESISSTDAKFSVTIDESYQLLMKDLGIHSSPVENESNPSKEFSFRINNINAENTLLKTNKLKQSETFQQDFTLQSLEINNLTNQDSQKATIATLINSGANQNIDVSGELTLDPFTLDSNLNVQNVSIEEYNSWIPEAVKLSVEKGVLSAQQKVSFNDKQFTSSGTLGVDELKLLDNNNELFLGVNNLSINESSVDFIQKSIMLNQIQINEASGNLTISEDKQLNLSGITNNEENESNSSEKDWLIEIKQIEFVDGQTRLLDKSISPNYSAQLSKLNGTIKGLSSENLSKADVDLTGLLDEYADLKINGQINPLSDEAYTDIKIQVQDLGLQNFSAYSGKYLGFPVNRGKVDLDLSYKLNKNILKGENNLQFKQLQLGDKTNSKEAVNIPLKLAVSLLTDGKGIMKINLPVSGNIDDPDFSYGGLVIKAFFKLITGIVASPFKILGKLVPNGDNIDLSGINFIPGSDQLSEAESNKLNAIDEILKKRPALILEMSSNPNSIEDIQAIKQKLLLQKLGISEKPEFSQEIELKPLKQQFITIFGKDKFEEAEVQFTNENQLDKAIFSQYLWEQLINEEHPAEQLQTLAKSRLQIVQNKLIEEFNISENRIFLKANAEIPADSQHIQFSIAH